MVTRFIIKRLAWSVFVLLGLSMTIFIVSRIVPGDPARMALGPRAPEDVVERYRIEMHYNEPIHIQYGYWLEGVVHGDLGRSLLSKRPIVEDVKEFGPATFELIVVAGLIQALFGLIIGVTSAMYSNRWPDNLLRVLGYVGVATPAFVMAVLLMLIFGFWWPILPSIGGRLSPDIMLSHITGFVMIDSLVTGNFRAFMDGLAHLAAPAFALAVGSMMQEARITRASMLDNLNKDYISLMTAQGVPRMTIITRFLLKPSVIPTVSIMGLDFAALFGNAFLVELIFQWPGLSRYGITAMLGKDLNAISAVVMVVGLVFVVTNIIVDIVVSYLDPRIIETKSSS